MAATLAVPQSVASHRTAAFLWGLVPSTDGDVHLTDLAETRQRTGLQRVVDHVNPALAAHVVQRRGHEPGAVQFTRRPDHRPPLDAIGR